MTKIRSILAASDLTEASDAVVRAAAEIAVAKSADLHILHAFDIPSGTAGGDAALTAASFPDRIRDSEKALDDQIARVVPQGARVASRRVEIYVAHRAIAECAEALPADLIVVGAHSHRRMGDELLGSTADRVIRAAEVPCLVMRTPLSLPLKKVVAPVDRSEAARGALEAAMAWGLILGATGDAAAPPVISVLHVLPRALDIPEFGVDPEKVGAELHAQVQEARGRVSGAGDLDVREEIRWADAALDEIIDFTREQAADLIVVGTHGHGALKRFLIGSVASGVARRAPCPVLLVPPGLWRSAPREGDGSREASRG